MEVISPKQSLPITSEGGGKFKVYEKVSNNYFKHFLQLLFLWTGGKESRNGVVLPSVVPFLFFIICKGKFNG